MNNTESKMSTIDRFEDALTQVAKNSVGAKGNEFAYMAGYMFSLLKQMAEDSKEAAKILENSTRYCEQRMYELNQLDIAA